MALRRIWPWSRIARLQGALQREYDMVVVLTGKLARMERDREHQERLLAAQVKVVRALDAKLAEQEALLANAFFRNPKSGNLMGKGVRP